MHNNTDCLIYNISLNGGNKSTSNSTSENTICHQVDLFYNQSFGIDISIYEWRALASIFILFIVISGTIFGNILVILGVFTYKPLRIVQNFYIVSLAAADLAVAVLVMPLNVTYMILGQWLWGKQLCKIWLTCDIMSCTSSILNLCAIALDRYWAITNPINYANKRTLKRVIYQIVIVWILSLIISSPPLLGWNDWPNEFTIDTPCQLTSEPGYVLYSSLGSFFIPLFIMTIVYIKIYKAVRKRLRKRTLVTCLKNKTAKVVIANQEIDAVNRDEFENEFDSEESIERCRNQIFMDMKRNLFTPLILLNDSVSQITIESHVHQAESDVFPCRNYKTKTNGSIKKLTKKPLVANVNRSEDVINKFIEQKQKISLSKERRAAQTLGIIMGVFIFCWLPFFLMYLVLPFCSTCCPSIEIINIITWLGYINSTLNPLIYTIFNVEFRKSFKKLLNLK